MKTSRKYYIFWKKLNLLLSTSHVLILGSGVDNPAAEITDDEPEEINPLGVEEDIEAPVGDGGAAAAHSDVDVEA